MNVMKSATEIVSTQHFRLQLAQRISQAFPSANCESYELPSWWDARIKRRKRPRYVIIYCSAVKSRVKSVKKNVEYCYAR